MFLIPLNDKKLKEAGIPLKAQSLRNWRAKGLYPEIFVKIGNRRIFIDLDKFKKTFLENQEA